MNVNGQNRDAMGTGGALRWAGRVVTADGLRESLNGERELVVTPRTVITPLAADHLKANGVRVVRQDHAAAPQAKQEEKQSRGWAYVLERPDQMVASVMQSLERDGVNMQELSGSRQTQVAPPGRECQTLACGLAREAAEHVIRGDYSGCVIFCQDTGLICCVANKIKGIRAAVLVSVAHARRVVIDMAPNLLALEIGRSTFFELRQILRGVCGGSMACPDSVAEILKELEGPCRCRHPGQESAQKNSTCQCGGGHAHR
jgi:ribose 5-phosphate isomerase RpiB